MAKVIKFNRADERTGPAPAADTPRRERRASAEIIIFPGVRYERWEEPAEARAGRRAKKRDRLELAE